MEVMAKLEGRQDYLLHGEPYARLFYSFPERPDEILQCQLSADAFDGDLQPGDHVWLTMLLRMVMEMRKA